jgi:hypothetical protein
VYAPSLLAERLWNLIPLSLSLLLISFIFWGPFYAPVAFAVLSMAFFTYWFIRSYSVAIACVYGLWRMRRWERIDWRIRFAAWLPGHPETEAWDWPRHMVIIPHPRFPRRAGQRRPAGRRDGHGSPRAWLR